MRDQRTHRLASRTLPSVPDVVSAKVTFQPGTSLPQDIQATNAAVVSLVTFLSRTASFAFGSCSHYDFIYCHISNRFTPP